MRSFHGGLAIAARPATSNQFQEVFQIMSKQSTRHQVARDRQQTDQAGRFKGFAAVLHRRGQAPRTIAEKVSQPPDADEHRVRISASSDPLLQATGAQSIEELDSLMDEVLVDIGAELPETGPASFLTGDNNGLPLFTPSTAIDLGSVDWP